MGNSEDRTHNLYGHSSGRGVEAQSTLPGFEVLLTECLIRGLRSGNKQKESPTAAQLSHQESGEQFPDQTIEAGSKSGRGPVQEQVSRTEFHPHVDVAESGHEFQRFPFAVSLRPRTLKVIENRLAQRFSAQASVTEPEHRARQRGMVIDHELRL